MAAESALFSAVSPASQLAGSLASTDMNTPKAISSDSIVALWKACELFGALGGECRRACLSWWELAQILPMMSQICAKVEEKEMISIARLPSFRRG